MVYDVRKNVIDRIMLFNFEQEFISDVCTGVSITYIKFFKKVVEILNTNIFKNKEIIVIMNNSLELCMLYFASMFSDSIIIPVDPEKPAIEIEQIKREHPGAYIITEFSNGNNLENINYICKETIIDLFKKIDYDREYLVTYTSGSTGNPKGVIHSAGNLFYSAIAFGEHISYNNEIIMSHTMPMTYMAGILNTIFLPFIFGGKIILLPRFNVKNSMLFWKNIEKYNVNTFWLSPTMLHLLMKIDKGNSIVDYFANRKIWFSVGTAPLSPKLKEEFEKKYKIKIYVSYGLSETLFVTSGNEDTNYNDSVGRVINGAEVYINTDKEILIKVPWIYKGYIENREVINKMETIYKSGDLGMLLENELKVTGRKKDLIIRGGININPGDIENCINKLEDIDEICVGPVMVNNEERIVCWYSGDDLDENKINNVIIEQLGRKYKIDYFRKLKSLPKNLNGKIDKKNLIKGFGK